MTDTKIPAKKTVDENSAGGFAWLEPCGGGDVYWGSLFRPWSKGGYDACGWDRDAGFGARTT